MMMIKMLTAALMVMLKTVMKSKNSNNINNNIIHNCNKTLCIVINEKQMFVKFLQYYFTVYIHIVQLFLIVFFFFTK